MEDWIVCWNAQDKDGKEHHGDYSYHGYSLSEAMDLFELQLAQEPIELSPTEVTFKNNDK